MSAITTPPPQTPVEMKAETTRQRDQYELDCFNAENGTDVTESEWREMEWQGY